MVVCVRARACVCVRVRAPQEATLKSVDALVYLEDPAATSGGREAWNAEQGMPQNGA